MADGQARGKASGRWWRLSAFLAFAAAGSVWLAWPEDRPAVDLEAQRAAKRAARQAKVAEAPRRVRESGPVRAVALPLDRVDRLVSLGGNEACALGLREIACTGDAGESWSSYGELPERVLAVVHGDTGSLLAAAADGTVYAISPEREPDAWAAPPASLAVADAAARDGVLWLLAHRYDEPGDELRLPTVQETVLLSLGPGGALERRGGSAGFRGDRLLVEPGGAIVTWASIDPRAWRTKDGGRTFARLPESERVGADFGGLMARVEHQIEKLPDRDARPISTLYISADAGSTWDDAFSTPGELLVDFADAKVGIAIARNESTAYLTRNGGRSFRMLGSDDRLAEAVDVTDVGGRFLAATADGTCLILGDSAR